MTLAISLLRQFLRIKFAEETKEITKMKKNQEEIEQKKLNDEIYMHLMAIQKNFSKIDVSPEIKSLVKTKIPSVNSTLNDLEKGIEEITLPHAKKRRNQLNYQKNYKL